MTVEGTRTNTISTGLAMFSMFFGAGNVWVPMALGVYAQDQNFYALLGLAITGILVPFMGLTAMTLFDGSYRHFFARVGKTPGFVLEILIMAIIGPLGAIPRCVTLSFSSIKGYAPFLSLPMFSALACLIIYLLTFNRKNILDILGYVLTPVLIFSLAVVIFKAVTGAGALPEGGLDGWQVFTQGMQDGYHTMDLMGAFFFSSMVLLVLKKSLHPTEHGDYRKLIGMTLKASCIGAGLLTLSYIGLSYAAAFHSESLVGIPRAEMINSLANLTLGSFGGMMASIAVALACLTTAIALSSVFAEFIHEDISNYRIGYQTSLIASLVITFFVSIMDFEWIVGMLAPILSIFYPALIALSLVSLLYKTTGFKPVKSIFYGVLVVTIIWLVYPMVGS